MRDPVQAATPVADVNSVAWPDPLWVFGYGSLMWDPGFAHEDARHARVYGYHRALCLLSVRNRGTPERPGLVLAMDRGGSCHGIAFRACPDNAEATRRYLWEREMYTGAYRPVVVRTSLADGEWVRAMTFVARPGHRQYFRAERPEQAAALVAQGRGSYGASLDYLRNVIRHLDQIGINDGPMHQVLALAEGIDRHRDR